MSAPAPRSTPAQGGPPAAFDAFPVISPDSITADWYREHGDRPTKLGRGCWYYSPLPANPTRGGRFDVPTPKGTCYFASTPEAAAMERVGRFTAQRKPVPADLIIDRVVSTVPADDLPDGAAELRATRAASAFGVTSELFTMSDYSVPQAWASSISNAGYDALVYTPRFSPGATAVSVFGPQGAKALTTAGLHSLSDVLRGAGIDVAPIPPASALTYATPPA